MTGTRLYRCGTGREGRTPLSARAAMGNRGLRRPHDGCRPRAGAWAATGCSAPTGELAGAGHRAEGAGPADRARSAGPRPDQGPARAGAPAGDPGLSPVPRSGGARRWDALGAATPAGRRPARPPSQAGAIDNLTGALGVSTLHQTEVQVNIATNTRRVVRPFPALTIWKRCGPRWSGQPLTTTGPGAG